MKLGSFRRAVLGLRGLEGLEGFGGVASSVGGFRIQGFRI